jgi:hypothetical protein
MNKTVLRPPPKGPARINPMLNVIDGPNVKDYKSISTLNQVYNTNKLNGVYHSSNNNWQIRRNINTRPITIENSSDVPVSFAITLYLTGPTPAPMYTLLPSEVFHISVNSSEAPTQILWLLDSMTGDSVGMPTALDRTVNSFVVRGGLNNFHIQRFHRIGYA